MNNLLIIYNILKDGKYHTIKEIIQILEISDKTARNLIKELKIYLMKWDIKLESVRSKGYILKGIILESSCIFDKNEKYIPYNSAERIDYIINKLVEKNEYVKIYDLSLEIYTSSRTISNDLKNIKNSLLKYNLDIVSKPYRGIKVVGNELDKRTFLVNYIERKINSSIFDWSITDKYNDLSNYTLEFIRKNNILMSDLFFFNTVLSIYLGIERMKQGFLVEEDTFNKFDIQDSDKLEILNEYLNGLEDIGIKIENEGEKKYILLHLFSKEDYSFLEKFKETKNIEIDEIIQEVFSYIKNNFKIKIKDEKKLYENLYSHLVPLTIRLRFNIRINNPLLKEIKEKMKLSFILAKYISEIICKKYDKALLESEIGYLAVIIEMGIDVKNNDKKDILIICPTGNATSKFLKYNYEKLFGKYINTITTVGMKDLKYIDLDEYDLIFSTINIDDKEYKVKIHQVNWFLEESEIKKVNRLFKKEINYTSIFPKELYFYIEEKLDKNTLLKFMSDKIKEIENPDFDIFSSVIKREELGFTELYNGIAIPHLLDGGYGFNKISVAILKHPILWDKLEVRIVLLICIDDIKTFDEEIYKKIGDLVSQKDVINNFLKKPYYDNFIEMIGDE